MTMAGPTYVVRNRLGEILAEQDTSQIDLARLSGVPYDRIRRITKGVGDIPAEDAFQICRVLESSVAEMFWLEAESGPADRS